MLDMNLIGIHTSEIEHLMDENDTWYGLIEYGLDYAVDYNYYEDEDGNSMFYFCTCDEEDDYPTVNTEISKQYSINKEDPNWLGKLIHEGLIFLDECLEKYA